MSTREHTPYRAVYAFLRTPLLPMDEFFAWEGGIRTPFASSATDDKSLEVALHADREALESGLLEVLKRPEINESIRIASPSLMRAFDEDTRAESKERSRNALLPLARYFSRMTFRPTPFGLFAGVTNVALGDALDLRLPNTRSYHRSVRLDSACLLRLMLSLARNGKTSRHLRFRTNSTLAPSAHGFVFDRFELDGSEVSWSAVKADLSAELRSVVSAARDGIAFSRLLELLVRKHSTSDAKRILDQLIDGGILEPERLLPIIGSREPHEATLEWMIESGLTGDFVSLFESMGKSFHVLRKAPLGSETPSYREIIGRLESALPGQAVQSPFHVDLFKPSSGITISSELADDVMKGYEILHSITRPRRDPVMAQFQRRFMERYEGQEIPLIEALDPMTGPGLYPDQYLGHSSLTEDLQLGGHAPPLVVELDSNDEILIRLASEAVRNGAQEIRLTKQDIEDLRRTNVDPLPDTFEVRVSLGLPESRKAARKKHDIVYRLGGWPGPRWASRFCFGSEALAKGVAALIRDEEERSPDAVFAEIVHVPSLRAANILTRPAFRKYEIPIHGSPSVPAEARIYASDLMISVRNGRFRLRSSRLDREVIPRLGVADLPSDGRFNIIYEFLNRLQGYGYAFGVSWRWGAMTGAPFLPRVCFENYVFFAASWKLNAREIKSICAGTEAERFRRIRELRATRNIPRQAVLYTRDPEEGILVDFENVLSVEAFCSALGAENSAVLRELYPGPKESLVDGPEGQFANELVLAYARQDTARQDAGGGRSGAQSAHATRSHEQAAPLIHGAGSEWLYLKIYLNLELAQDVVLGLWKSLIRKLEKAGVIDRWFFVNYKDPEHHVRLRLHGAPKKLLREALPAALDRLAGSPNVWKYTIDQYVPETVKYGGVEAIPWIEEYFHADSRAALEVLRIRQDDPDTAWMLALVAADRTYSDLGVRDAAKLEAVERARDFWGRELFSSHEMKCHVGARFRAIREELERFLEPSREGGMGRPLERILRMRSVQTKKACAEMRRLDSEGRLQNSMAEISRHLVHMTMNRMLSPNANTQEAIIYNYLHRLYETKRKRILSREAPNRPSSK